MLSYFKVPWFSNKSLFPYWLLLSILDSNCCDWDRDRSRIIWEKETWWWENDWNKLPRPLAALLTPMMSPNLLQYQYTLRIVIAVVVFHPIGSRGLGKIVTQTGNFLDYIIFLFMRSYSISSNLKCTYQIKLEVQPACNLKGKIQVMTLSHLLHHHCHSLSPNSCNDGSLELSCSVVDDQEGSDVYKDFHE